MSSPPWIRLYPSDYLSATCHLGLLEHGIYWRLLLHYYEHGKPLPGDIDRIARIIHAVTPEEKRTLEYVLPEFFTLKNLDDGTRVWVNKRAEKEIEQALTSISTYHHRGVKGANVRHGKDKDAQAMLEQCLSNANHNHNHNQNQNQNHSQSQNQRSPAEPVLEDTEKLGNVEKHVRHKTDQKPPQAAGGVCENQESFPQEFMRCWEIWQTRLAREGSNPKQAAFRAWSARRKGGATFEELYEGTVRYADYCQAKGIVGSQFVKMASTFYGPSLHFQEEWQVHANSTYPQSITERNAAVKEEFFRRLREQERTLEGECHEIH